MIEEMGINERSGPRVILALATHGWGSSGDFPGQTALDVPLGIRYMRRTF